MKWGRFWGVRRPEPVGGSKVPSTFVLQSTAPARCLRSIPPVRHRASARALVFVGSVAGPRCSTLAARYRSHAIRSPRPLPSVCFRRSSRALWSPLLASLSSLHSSCPPPARHSVRSGFRGWGRRLIVLLRRGG